MIINTPDNRIFVFYKKLKADNSGRRYSYIEVDGNDLRIFDKKCYVSYAGEGEIVVLLKDDDINNEN